MKTTMTFAEVRATTPVYPTMIEDDLQATINSWFDNRHVNNNNTFVNNFQRVIYRDYDRYLEMLRIEPGYAKYDWLVQKYMEHKTDTLRTPNLTETGSNSGLNVTSGNDGATHTIVHSGNDVTQKSGKDTHTADYTDTDTYNNLSDVAMTGTKRTTATTHPTQTARHEIARNLDHKDYTGSDTVNLDKNNPMSASYTAMSFISGDPATEAAAPTSPSLDWTSLSNQSESGSVSHSSSADIQLPDNNFDTDTVSFSGDDVVEVSESGGRQKNGSIAHVKKGTTDEIAYGETDTLTHGETITDTVQGNKSEREELTGSSTKQTTGTDSTITKNRYTGRDEAPADLLEKAKNFISRTSAWAWFYSQLDVCFMGVYEI